MKNLFIVFLASLNIAAFELPFSTEIPPWFSEDSDSSENDFFAGSPRVVDLAELFSDSEEADLTERIEQSVAETGIDFVIYTDTTNYGVGNGFCADNFFRSGGYGLGEDDNGSVLFINMDPDEREYYVYAHGDCRDDYTSSRVDELKNRIMDDMSDGHYYKAMTTYIENITRLHKKGSLPKSRDDILLCLIIALVIGLISGALTMGTLTSKMKTVKTAVRAEQYLVPGSMKMRRTDDCLLYVTTTRTKRQTNDSNG